MRRVSVDRVFDAFRHNAGAAAQDREGASEGEAETIAGAFAEAFRMSERFRELASRIVAFHESDLAAARDPSLSLQVECQAEHYWPGDLFIQVLRLEAARQVDGDQVKGAGDRLSVLRGELRAMIWADAKRSGTLIDAGIALAHDRRMRDGAGRGEEGAGQGEGEEIARQGRQGQGDQS